MNDSNIKELKTWPLLVIKNLKAFEPMIYQKPEFGPIVNTKYCWIYKKGGKFIVHDKDGENSFRFFDNWKSTVVDVVIRFESINKKEKNEII